MRPDRSPGLLTSRTSAALLDGRGNLEYPRETRGTWIDWGGVYGQLVRLTGPWTISLEVNASPHELPATLVASEPAPGGWRSRHRMGRLEVEQTVLVLGDLPGVARTFCFTADPGSPIRVTIENHWSPFLLPVLIEGIRPVEFHLETRAEELLVRQREFGLSFQSNVPPSRLYLNRGSWRGGRFDGPVEEVGSDHEVQVTPGATSTITFVIHGGLERDLRKPSELVGIVRDPLPFGRAVEDADLAWMERRPRLQFPDAPALERAYSLACAALRRLYTAPGDDLCGLVAGYPWYSAIWCRDLAWMLPAVLWLGDFDWTERSLSSVFRFQSHTRIPILGGEKGELPMQISPGPIFLYGTSDTTLYYPSIIEQFLRHSGRAASVAPWSPVVEQILGWGEARTNPTTGLFRNGGEASSIGAVRSSFARVRYGINAPDTTIWDSTDRRDHAIDLQVLWREALLAGARLLSTGSTDPRIARWTSLADRALAAVRSRYVWKEEAYLFDSINAEGPVRKLRPNALRVVSAGWLDPGEARGIVDRVAKEDLTTAWGVRTLSSRDPSYDPIAYHDGQVWTIATSWAADAALSAGMSDVGAAYLGTIARLIGEEAGYANECYRGDRAEPFDSCFLLGFSIAPFLTILFERLWGLRVDVPMGRVEVRPIFPASWTAASIERLTVGSGSLTIAWSPQRLRVRWSGPISLTLVTRAGETVVASGADQFIDLPVP